MSSPSFPCNQPHPNPPPSTPSSPSLFRRRCPPCSPFNPLPHPLPPAPASLTLAASSAVQVEERQTDWAYSKPVVILDVVWNFTSVLAAITVMMSSREEMPSMPHRVWIAGYALQCVLHVVCVIDEFRRRERIRTRGGRSEDAESDGLVAEVADDERDRLGSFGQYCRYHSLGTTTGQGIYPGGCSSSLI